MNSAKDFFDSIINKNDTSLFTYGLKPIEMPNLEKAQLIQNNTPDAFLKEYYNAISAINKIIDNDSGTNTLNSSAILLRLIHINAEFKIDSKSLAELLIDLSNQIKEFSTTYEHHKYDEYLYVDGKLELVGNWEVDLADYATKDDLELKVDKVEGKALVDLTEIAKLATVKENAEPNYITSVDETELKVDNGLLSVISIVPSKVAGLEELLNNKADASKVETLTTNLDIVSTKVTNIEAQLNSFVSVETYNKDIAEIKDAITWKTL